MTSRPSRIRLALSLSLFVAIAAQAQAAAIQNCSAAPHHQFDFWIGHWDVTTPDGKPAGENRIEPVANGCALLENWQGKSGFAGKSINSYDRNDQRWHQEWVDSAGGRLTLAGGWTAGKMVLQGTLPDANQPEKKVLQRISWTPNADGSVRQLWETSSDDGKTWSTAFDGKYVKRKQ